MRNITLLIAICLLWGSCKKEKSVVVPAATNTGSEYPNINTYFYPDDSTVANFLYQPGTWWVYRDLTDLSSDSVWVSSFQYNEALCTIPNNNTQHFYYYYISLAGDTNDIGHLLIHKAVHSEHSFSYFPVSNRTLFDYYSTGTNYAKDYITFYDSLQLQGNWYYNVSKVRPKKVFESTTTIDSSYYYVNKTFGIIKKEVYNSSSSTYKSYELIHANIVH